ncbi:putative mitochondrial ribosomal protein l12 strongylocentrotus purpuratus [Fasciolopsis buskii]|uniref:Putative mitochondrial ribosomal protein l12 strongylocentrotus purpuratus n=1 Tax=Fasciolopsis buskii TaxID=27845 RepID=A0A8E0VEQ9_9TREM|nr:putative mitochondrial ribosomal protein l12 strongylocentrotus purpuratus [Fasciolopsis buski]
MLVSRKLSGSLCTLFLQFPHFRIRCGNRALIASAWYLNHRLSSTQPKAESSSLNLHPPHVPESGGEKTYPGHIIRLVDAIASMTLLEVADLTELLQKRLNIKSPGGFMPTMNMSSVTAASPQAEEVEEEQAAVKSSFTVKLIKFDAAKKVPLIKEIKQIVPEMNLVQAKKFVESAPGNIKTDVSREEAEEIKKTLEGAGATIEIE